MFSVEGDGQIRTLIRAEELPETSTPIIRKKIKQRLSFNGTGLRPLENLQDFDFKLRGNIDRIIYVTGSSLRDEESISGSDLGTPLNWKLSGVKLDVITTGSCPFWKNKARARNCSILKSQNSKSILNTALKTLALK